jgi:hypothetical protein
MRNIKGVVALDGVCVALALLVVFATGVLAAQVPPAIKRWSVGDTTFTQIDGRVTTKQWKVGDTSWVESQGIRSKGWSHGDTSWMASAKTLPNGTRVSREIYHNDTLSTANFDSSGKLLRSQVWAFASADSAILVSSAGEKLPAWGAKNALARRKMLMQDREMEAKLRLIGVPAKPL